MPVARIFSESTSDAARLVPPLQALGYTVEIVPPRASDLESHADLEIWLDYCSRTDALAEAERRARKLGSDIYIAGGALRLTETVHGMVEPEPAQDRFAQGQTVVSRDDEPVAIRDPLAPVVNTVPEIAESFVAHAAEAPPFTSQPLFDDLNATVTGSEDSAQGSEDSAQPVNAPMVIAGASTENDTSSSFTLFGGATSAEELPSPIDDRWTVTFAKAVASLWESASQLTEKATNAFASGGRRAVGKLRAARQTHPQRALDIAAARVESAPAPVEIASAPVEIARDTVTADRVPAPPLHEVASPPSASPIAIPHPAPVLRPLPWMAFATAGAAVVAALLGWSVLTGRSATPNVPINGSIEQQVPFGPVKIVPPARQSQPPAKVKPVTATPAHPVAAAPIANSSSRAKGNVPAKPKTTMRHAARSGNRSRQQVADDEVIVHHYKERRSPTQAKVTNTGIKHISDQE